ncbi:MAG: hypothetical protein L3J09_00045 [Flavobacteriaceae bacterium]|nr:hypothetical protein [Flavobacteriaceae bacterium]
MKNTIRFVEKSLFLILLLIQLSSFSQSETNCNLKQSKNNEINAVDANDFVCLAKNTEKDKIIVFTFGLWCSPCIAHLDNAISLKENYNVDFYVLLVDNEDENELIKKTIIFLRKKREDINIVILKDEYGKRRNRKYKNFLKEMTPNEFENIGGMSKYLVYNNEGKVIMVTTWKDREGDDWRDDSSTLKNKVIPLLKKL